MTVTDDGQYAKAMFSDDEEQRPLMTEEELRDACLHAAATVVIAVALGCEFEDCMLDDDGYKWPTSISRIYFKYPKEWTEKGEALSSVATIHEAGAMAVAKRHGRGPHLIIDSRTGAFPGDSKTRRLLTSLASGERSKPSPATSKKAGMAAATAPWGPTLGALKTPSRSG